jgi:hypothetical protein
METIAILQLTNSENIIGVIHTASDTDSITIDNPMSLMLDSMSGGLGMMPYLAIYTGTLSKEKTILKKHIIGVLEEDELTPEIIEKYKEYKQQVLDGLKEEENKQPNLFDHAEIEEEGK